MTLFEQIKVVYLEKRKAREAEAVGSLSTLIGEIETLAKAGRGDADDASVVAVVKKFIKNLDETAKVAPSDKLARERVLFESFLPKQLSAQELNVLIDGFVAGGASNVGETMKLLKQHHAGTYDGAMASMILKARFA